MAFNPGDIVLCRLGWTWLRATIVRLIIPYHRDVDEENQTQFSPAPGSTALVKLDDGREMTVPFADLKQHPE